MQLKQFKNFISEFPFENQSFDIKKDIWKVQSQQQEIDAIFQDQNTITINRFDLYNATSNIKVFIIKTLMWGYPTKGRGKNIDNLLKPTNFNTLTETLKLYQNKNITAERLKSDIKNIEGLGLSTLTKFTNFLDTTIDNNKAVILDNQIIEAINTKRFEEFSSLIGISYDNAPNKYTEYISIINELSKNMNVKPDQIEMFLFTFGRNLSQLSTYK
uniref:8-oxoguanine DNA glycosylase OGG fold protein n=1 Tax=Gelidibacter sp. TaxID=2018083 RepID=UPI004049C442